MVSLGALGVIRSVGPAQDGVIEVEITPTFLGCPAMPEIESDIRDVLAACGHPEGRVRQVLSPAWSSEWISAYGRRKLAEHGIAPPAPVGAPLPLRLGTGAPCPNCGCTATRPQSLFGATRCQVIVVCTGCKETFPRFRTV
ncbi:ring-1,2-phenylacetyl-CoA epoxidase subunit PaaD [Kitasatospora kifunensis]|uniref:Ring-1,2-phenylacetyl-CoA epoxidase subunit PaaD n=2 Tax=Kitasatospora kifunensis TaxID=58351 RepID=A0A7W7RA28_KITKI|nr:ring-1,2-phenylacetyl-CoA epoxidase subunit PaaD [Kitasatospora kifunensis]